MTTRQIRRQQSTTWNSESFHAPVPALLCTTFISYASCVALSLMISTASPTFSPCHSNPVRAEKWSLSGFDGSTNARVSCPASAVLIAFPCVQEPDSTPQQPSHRSATSPLSLLLRQIRIGTARLYCLRQIRDRLRSRASGSAVAARHRGA